MAMTKESPTGRPETLVSYASRRIQAALASGEIPAGARISPKALAKELDLSHSPVREALSSLAATGYVIYERRRGYFARELSSEDLDDIYSLREILETEAYRRGVPQLTDDDVLEMRHLVGEMATRVSPEFRSEYLELNRQFHFVPFRRSGSRRLTRFLNSLWDAALPYATLGEVDSSEGNAEHEALLSGLEARDPEAVIAIMRHHRDIRRERVEGWEQSRLD
jgi:DNA-binding GntR family transcriptional regulator